MQGKGQKNHPYLKAVIILAFVCAYMAVCAYFAPDMKIGEFRLSTVHIGTDSPESITVYTQDTVSARRQTDAPERDTMPPKVLLLGDSMIEGLAKPFGEYAKHNGFTLTAAIWYGSTTQTWAECDTLDSLMDKIRPQAVAVSLGGNELFIRHPERRAEYIDRTDNHVLYQVTPVFEGDELVARGVEMEGYSVEDHGEGISFHVFAYNVEPGVEIDYETGDNCLADEEPW